MQHVLAHDDVIVAVLVFTSWIFVTMSFVAPFISDKYPVFLALGGGSGLLVLITALGVTAPEADIYVRNGYVIGGILSTIAAALNLGRASDIAAEERQTTK